MLNVVQRGEESDGGTAGFRSLIDEIGRDGARKMLAAALQAEVAAYVEQFADQVDEDGRRLVVRNGYHQPRTVVTSAGAVEVKAPRGERQADGPGNRGAATVLLGDSARMGATFPADHRGSAAAVPARPVLRRLRSGARAVPRHRRGPVGIIDHPADDAVAGRLEQEKLCLVVMIGVHADGRKELVALTDGFRESHESWADCGAGCR